MQNIPHLRIYVHNKTMNGFTELQQLSRLTEKYYTLHSEPRPANMDKWIEENKPEWIGKIRVDYEAKK